MVGGGGLEVGRRRKEDKGGPSELNASLAAEENARLQDVPESSSKENRTDSQREKECGRKEKGRKAREREQRQGDEQSTLGRRRTLRLHVRAASNPSKNQVV